MTYFKHLLTLLLAVTCLHVSAKAAPAEEVSNDLPSITFMSGTTTLSDNLTVPNGTLIQLQANNFPEDAVFSYLIGKKAATADDFNKKSKDKKNNGILGNTPLVYQHGIPVFASSTTSSQTIVLSVQVSKPETDKESDTTYPQYYTLSLKVDGTTTAVAPPRLSLRLTTKTLAEATRTPTPYLLFQNRP